MEKERERERHVDKETDKRNCNSDIQEINTNQYLAVCTVSQPMDFEMYYRGFCRKRKKDREQLSFGVYQSLTVNNFGAS